MISLTMPISPTVDHPNQTSVVNLQFTWQAILWRLLLTLLLLLLLAGSGLTVFSNVTVRPDTHVLPTLTQEAEGEMLDVGR